MDTVERPCFAGLAWPCLERFRDPHRFACVVEVLDRLVCTFVAAPVAMWICSHALVTRHHAVQVSPAYKAFVELVEPMCGAVDFNIGEMSPTYVVVAFEDASSRYLDRIHSRFMDVIRIVSDSFDLNVRRVCASFFGRGLPV